MCASLQCPNCDQQTYHKGMCENEKCGYDPLNVYIGRMPKNLSYLSDSARLLGCRVQNVAAPFPLLRISGSKLAIARLTEHLGYTGQPFYHLSYDPLDEEYYGIDLVKDTVVQLTPNG